MKTCVHHDKIPDMHKFKSFVNSDFVWPNGYRFRIYFETSNQADKTTFMDLIRTHYIPYANFTIQEVSDFNQAEIRVFFTNDGASWSRIGTTSVLYQPVTSTPTIDDYSMQIGEIQQDTILHEWGHAIGWFHEHTHPDKPWTYNEEEVLKDLLELGWSRQEIYDNVLTDRQNPDNTPYDVDSIMHYYLPMSWTVPPQVFKVNSVLSAQDKYTLRLMYPYPMTVDEIDHVCDGFCRPSETQIDRELWDTDVRIAFSPTCTQDQIDKVKAVIRTVYLPYFPYKIIYVPWMEASHVRIDFGPGRENFSVVGKQPLLTTTEHNIHFWSQCHVAVIIHHVGHVIGLRDNYLQYSCGNVSEQLQTFLLTRPNYPDSIMSNQKTFSIQNFYLSDEDKQELLLLYGFAAHREIETHEERSVENDDSSTETSMVWVIPVVVTGSLVFLILLGLGIRSWRISSATSRNKQNND